MNVSSILFQNDSKTVVLLDLPRSLEEAQVPSHRLTNADPPKLKRLVSAQPPATPFPTPEPKRGISPPTASVSAQVADLMTRAAAESAISEISQSYNGPWLLPRLYSQDSHPDDPTFPAPPAVDAGVRDDSSLIIPDAACHLQRKRGGYHPVRDMDSVQSLLSLIPVGSHLAVDGLLVVWVTNSPSATDVLTSPHNGLFAQWDVELVGEWMWLKVTTEGEPLFALDSSWRKPWERLLIARKRGGLGGPSIANKVIIAVPDVHSRKPNLRHLFEDSGLLPEGYLALEVFARNLTAGWWSWGEEVLLFQHRKHWLELPEG
jgi:N6-adenosine-specific RNA methylase IME4